MPHACLFPRSVLCLTVAGLVHRTVLCCPGCFSLFRIDALRDTLFEYSSKCVPGYHPLASASRIILLRVLFPSPSHRRCLRSRFAWLLTFIIAVSIRRSSVEQALDFLTKDMGEDRWLCTLLVLHGWRLEYTAVSIDYTFCPTSFDELYNQVCNRPLCTPFELVVPYSSSSRMRLSE